jgi:hypothetical protein
MIRYPLGGQIAAHLQYVLGLARMGYDVFFVENAGWENACFDPRQGVSGDDPATGADIIAGLFRRHGLDGRWTFVDVHGSVSGAPRDTIARLAPEAPLISLSDVTWLPEFEKCPVRVYIDEDPAFPQIGLAGGDSDLRAVMDRYTVHATYGESIGKPGCLLPTCGMDWVPTRQPIVLDLWENQAPPGERWTTLMNWTSYANVTLDGVEYGQKDVEFRRVIDLPRRTWQSLEVAINAPENVQKTLRDNGWAVTDAVAASRSLDSYGEYIAGSRGEFSVAKEAYVKTRSGWFSDRSAAYLASGRPVVLQDTGFADHLPTGDGLFQFSDAASAVDALARCASDLRHHASAAKAVATEHLRHDLVLRRLLDKAGIE